MVEEIIAARAAEIKCEAGEREWRGKPPKRHSQPSSNIDVSIIREHPQAVLNYIRARKFWIDRSREENAGEIDNDAESQRQVDLKTATECAQEVAVESIKNLSRARSGLVLP